MAAAQLRAFIEPDETGFDVGQRTKFEPIKSGVPILGSLRATQVLEVEGPSGSSKSTMLLQVGHRNGLNTLHHTSPPLALYKLRCLSGVCLSESCSCLINGSCTGAGSS